ncbi:MAG: hypothetical protein IT371_18485 [Deltaproteobacteria bacterium]|nr:hypothetical protein [Deltaproteobacteria bacterium]
MFDRGGLGRGLDGGAVSDTVQGLPRGDGGPYGDSVPADLAQGGDGGSTGGDARRDGKGAGDLGAADLRRDAGGPRPDSSVLKPIYAQALGQAFRNTKVPCIDNDGKKKGGDISIVDSATVTFVQGTVTLGSAPADTKAWVGGKSAVTIVWDINACGDEDPVEFDGSWTSVGLLVRGATLVSGQLVLAPGTTIADIDFLDVDSSGIVSGQDFARPDDSELATNYLQLVEPVRAAKQGVLTMAQP